MLLGKKNKVKNMKKAPSAPPMAPGNGINDVSMITKAVPAIMLPTLAPIIPKLR